MAGVRWTPEHDSELIVAVRVFGPFDYERIAERLKRTEYAVQQRMSKGPKPVRNAVQEAARQHRAAQVEQEPPKAAEAAPAVSRDKQLETRIIRLREEGRSWSAIGDTVGMKRDKVRSIFAVAVGERLPEELDIYEALRPIEMPPPPTRPCTFSASDLDIIVSDMHWPKSDRRAEAVALEAIKRLRPATVYINGDAWDLEAFSKYDSDFRKRFHWNPQDEADAGAKFLYLLEEIVQEWDGKIVCIDGSNHHDRWWKYLSRVAPALIGMDRAEELLGFDKWWIPAWSRMRMVDEDVVIMPDSNDPLVLTHGNIVRAQGGASANAMGRKIFSSVAHAHTHRVGMSVIRVPARGSRPEQVWRCYELGCLADLQPGYTKRPDWQQGFGILHRDEKEQLWTMEPVVILDGKATIASLGGTICA